MKEKIKKFFSKDNLFILICTFLIAIFVFLCVIYHNKDVESYENKNKSNINLVEDNLDLNTSWSYDNIQFDWNWQNVDFVLNNSYLSTTFYIYCANSNYSVTGRYPLILHNGYVAFDYTNISGITYNNYELYYNNEIVSYINISTNQEYDLNFDLNGLTNVYNYNFHLYDFEGFSGDRTQECFTFSKLNDKQLFKNQFFYSYSSNLGPNLFDISYFDFYYSSSTNFLNNSGRIKALLNVSNEMNIEFDWSTDADTFKDLFKVSSKVSQFNVFDFLDYNFFVNDWNNLDNSQVAAQIADLQSQVSSLQADIVSKNAQIADLQSQVSFLQADIVSKNAQIADLQSQVSSLQADIVSKNAQIADLQNQLSQVQVINENENVLLNYKDSKFYYNGSQIYSSQNLWTEYDPDTGFTYLNLYDGEAFEHLDYVEVLYDTITIDKSLLYVLTNSVGPFSHIIFYNNNNSVLELNYPYNSSTEMPFPIELYDTYTFNKIRVYNLIPSGYYSASGNKLYLSSSNASYNYLLGYQVGYDKGLEALDSLQADYDNLENSYNSLNSNYNTLLHQYNDLANNEYTFSELFWSISSVPFGVLASGFNVNVLGVNLAAIITGLFTALLIIWIIKKFLK